jgi:hypothetical protein
VQRTGYEDEPSEIWVIDLLSDLMHMCDRDKLNFENLLRIAREHYQSEAEHYNEDPLETLLNINPDTVSLLDIR